LTAVYTLINRTVCQVHPQLMLDAHAEEHLLIVAKASFVIQGRQLTAADAEVVLADRYHGDPGTSSLAAAGEVMLFKPRPDLILSGDAYPTTRGGTTGLVSFRVGAWTKQAAIFGDRTWTRGLTGLRPGEPQPFESIALQYERAFGGAALDAKPPLGCPENPVGVGMIGCRAGSPLPNLEHPSHLLEGPGDRPPPCAFGPIAPHWQPRLGLHGTFDAAWQRGRMPLPPLDTDPRAAQVAPPDQVYPATLRGGEAVEVRGARPGGERLSFHLPVMPVRITVHDGQRTRDLPTALDTVHVDANNLRLELIWRASVSVHERLDDVEWVRVDTVGAPHA
jgi:hypothetical protein